jgi:formylglycine-generating enzyme
VTIPRQILVLACLAAPLPACAAETDGGLRISDPPGTASALATPLSDTVSVNAPAPPSAPEPEPVAPSAPEPVAPSAPEPACPAKMARIEGYCIDRYEAHLVARAGGELRAHPHYRRLEEGVTYEARSEPAVFPQAYISRVEAQAACENAGKRLCSMKEWQRACKGALGATYPYGQRVEPGRCNTDKPHLLTLRFGPDPGRWAYAQFNDPSLSQEPGFLAKAGEYAGCASDAGIHDLVGNLHEWVSDIAGASFKARLDSEGIPRAFQHWAPGNGVFMGGFFSTHGELGPGCTFTTVAHDPAYHDYSTGFRCCADPH